MAKPKIDTVFCYMIFRYTCITILLTAFFYCASAQQRIVRGRIFRDQTDEVLMGVDIDNISQQLHRQSDLGGNFKISAKVGDILVFSNIGYLSDTVRVLSYIIDSGYNVMLRPETRSLPMVSVQGDLNKYQLDSLKRREDYRYIYDRTAPKIAGGTTPSNGVGIGLSPVTYFSKKEKEVRHLRKRLGQNEQNYYVDYKFSRSYVAKLTRLQGDSLQLFMKRYTPSYSFCRKTSSDGMMLYINESLKSFLKRN
jgi:hypothetical protein